MGNNGYVFTQSAFDSSFATSTGQTIGAGVLSPEAADHFIDTLFQLTSLYNRAQIIQMGAPSRRVSTATFGKRLLRPGQSGTSPTYFSQTSVSEKTLNAQLMKAIVKVNDEELEDNIIKGDLTNYVIGKIQEQIANEIEYACLMGQKTNLQGSPAYVDHQMDGWYYLSKNGGGHVVDGSALGDAGYLQGGTAGQNTRHYTKRKPSVAARVIPAKYKTQQKGFTHFVSAGVYEEMIDTYADRPNTGANVMYEANGAEPNLPMGNNSRFGYMAYPFALAPLLPENLFFDKPSGQASTTLAANVNAGQNVVVVASATGLAVGDGALVDNPTYPNAERAQITAISGTTVTLSCPDTADGNFAYPHAAGSALKNGTLDRTFLLTTYPKNLLVGVWREVKIEPTRWGPESATYFTLSLRMDVQLEIPDAVAIVDNMTATTANFV